MDKEPVSITFHAPITKMEMVEDGLRITLEDGSVFVHRPGEEPELVSAPSGIN